MDLTLKIVNSIFPKVCKNGFKTFVHGPLDYAPNEQWVKMSEINVD